MKKIIFCLLFVKLLMNTSFAVDSVWVNYASFTNYYGLNSIAVDKNLVKWIGTYQNGLYKFNGHNWILYDTINSGLPFMHVNALSVDSNNVLWLGNFAGGTSAKGIVKYDGTNWTRYTTSNSGLCANAVNYIATENNNALWICTSNGLSKFHNNVWTTYNVLNNWFTGIAFDDSIKWVSSTDGIARFDGVNWITYTVSNSGLPSNVVFGIATDSSGNVWVATLFGGIAKFNYYANEWTVYNENNSGLPDNNTSCITVDKEQAVWIGTYSQMAKFFNGNWYLFSTGPNLASTTIAQIVVDKFDNKWFCTVAGVCAFYPHGITAINPNQTIIKDYHLSQNYPNPFNSSTKIEYSIKKNSVVKILVTDIKGSQVDEIYSGYKHEGSYSVSYNANNLSSGVYFYSIIINDKIADTKKFVLLK